MLSLEFDYELSYKVPTLNGWSLGGVESVSKLTESSVNNCYIACTLFSKINV